MQVAFPILTYVIFLPVVGAVLTYALGNTERLAKWVALAFSLVSLGLGSTLLLGFLSPSVFTLTATTIPSPNPLDVQTYYAMETFSWFPQLNVQYLLGADELSVVLVFLNTLLTPLAIAFSWDEHHRAPELMAMFLFLECTVNGIFLSLNLLQFLVFWEVQLVPMYFIIAIWGGPRRKYASLKFFLYTFLASLPLLLSVFAFYFYSNPHTFDITQIIATTPIPVGTIGDLMFVAMLVAFGTKLPTFPLHTWLPDAHVEAPTGGSVLLAGVLLKMGGYGIFRVDLGMFPDAMRNLWWVLAALGVISMVYAAFVCLHQTDLKRLIAYSSVGHMGFVTLGAATLTTIGVEGGIFQMFNHGLITAVLFMLAGSVKHATGTRDIPKLQGLAKVMPQFSLILMIGFFASLGLPGLNSFWSEFMVFLGTYSSPTLAATRALVIVPLVSIVVTAAYYVYTMQRTLFGDLPKEIEHAHDLPRYESFSYAILIVLIFAVGFLPFVVVGPISQYVATLPGLTGVV